MQLGARPLGATCLFILRRMRVQSFFHECLISRSFRSTRRLRYLFRVMSHSYAMSEEHSFDQLVVCENALLIALCRNRAISIVCRDHHGLVGVPPARWSFIREPLEDSREIGLLLESDGNGYFSKRHISARKHFFCAIDPLLEHIVTRSTSGGYSELCRKVHTR